MSAIFHILIRLILNLLDGFLFTAAIVVWIGILALFHSVIREAAWQAPTFLVGLLAILLFSVIPAFRDPRPSSENTTQP